MMRWIRNNGLPLALTLVVIFSLILSGVIWLSPDRTAFQRTNNNNVGLQMSTQTLGNTYLPTQVVVTNKNGEQKLNYGEKRNTVLTIREDLEKMTLGRLSTVRTDNSDLYLSYLRSPNSIMLSYPDRVPTQVFNEAFSTNLNVHRVAWINHLVIPTSGNNIYLLTDRNYSIYRVRVDSGNLNRLKTLAKGKHQLPADYRIVNGMATLMMKRSFKLPVYGYQVTTKNADNLIQNLLSATNLSSLNKQVNGDVTTYLSGTNRQVAYNRSLGTLTYQNFQSRNSSPTASELFNDLYNRINDVGLDLENVRYDSYNQGRLIVTFRSYVNGFPIYNNNGYGAFKMQLSRNGMERYELSLYSIQVPLPINSASVRLPSSSTVLNELRQAGKYHDLHGLRVGYTWPTQTSGARSDAVRLVPTYYVNYHGNWVDYQTLIK